MAALSLVKYINATIIGHSNKTQWICFQFIWVNHTVLLAQPTSLISFETAMQYSHIMWTADLYVYIYMYVTNVFVYSFCHSSFFICILSHPLDFALNNDFYIVQMLICRVYSTYQGVKYWGSSKYSSFAIFDYDRWGWANIGNEKIWEKCYFA